MDQFACSLRVQAIATIGSDQIYLFAVASEKEAEFSVKVHGSASYQGRD